MFEDAIKALENSKSISIPIEEDKKGYIDKQCPSEDCEFIFKLHKDQLETVEENDKLYCPFCRHEALPDSWYTIEQIKSLVSIDYLNDRYFVVFYQELIC